MSSTYSNRQIEVANLLRSTEREEVTSDVIDEIMAIIEDAEAVKSNDEKRDTSEVAEEALRMQILNEPDWRKRASMAAMIISRNLQ